MCADTVELANTRSRTEALNDPLFVNAKKYDFHLRPDSPALKLGFKDIDLSTVGPRHPTNIPN